MPVGTTFGLTGGTGQAIGGAVYFPKGQVQWAGNASLSQRCTQIVADTIQLVGDSGLSINCAGYGTRRIGNPTALVE